MFFPEKITSIQPTDRVLEIGPGSTPHPRSNAFLELHFASDQDRLQQRGGGLQEADFGGRPVHHYGGGRFPFADGQFDYVICSHVIEHVPRPEEFVAEVFRTGGSRGYFEYPLITYEYLYDFSVHRHFVKFDSAHRVLRYLPKEDTALQQFAPVSTLLRQTLALGWDDACAANKSLFFEGFEYAQPFAVERSSALASLCPPAAAARPKKGLRRLLGRVLNKLGQ